MSRSRTRLAKLKEKRRGRAGVTTLDRLIQHYLIQKSKAD